MKLLTKIRQVCLSSWMLGLGFAFILFLPSIMQGGKNISFIAQSLDQIHLWYPQLLQTSYWNHRFIFDGIDYYTHGGSNEFFLRANLVTYNPVVFFLSFIFSPTSGTTGLYFILLLYIIFTIWGTRSLFQLAAVEMGFGKKLAFFITAGYFFSSTIIYAMGFLPFFLIFSLTPIMIHALCLQRRVNNLSTGINLFWASLNLLLAGYLPLQITVYAISLIFFFIWTYYIIKEPMCLWNKNFYTRLLGILSPTILAVIILTPIYIAFNNYFRSIENRMHNLYIAADMLSLRPFDMLLNIIYFFKPRFGISYEYSFTIGLIPLTLIIWTLFKKARTTPIAGNEKRFLCVCFIVLTILILGSWGRFTPIPELIYFLIPIIGGMHLYQRHLMWGALFFWFGLAIVFKILITEDLRLRAKITLGVIIILISIISYGNAIGYSSSNTAYFLNPSTVVDLFYVMLFTISIFLFSSHQLPVIAAVFLSLSPLQTLWAPSYDSSYKSDELSYSSISFDPTIQAKLIDYLKSNSNGQIIKIVNLLPNWYSYIPKNYSWILRGELEIFDYYGYEPHIGTPVKYTDCMSAVTSSSGTGISFRPCWDWIKKTNGGFVFFDANDPDNDPQLFSKIDQSRALVLKKGYTVAPLLKTLDPEEKFSNNVIKITGMDNTTVQINKFVWNKVNDIKFSIDSNTESTMYYLFWPNSHLKYFIDSKRVPVIVKNGLQTITIPAGHHGIHIYYKNSLITATIIMIAISLTICSMLLFIIFIRYLTKTFVNETKR